MNKAEDICETDRVRNFKFGERIYRRAFKPENAKVGQKWRSVRHVTYFYNFGTPFLSLEQTKLDTSIFVCRLIVWPSNQKNTKLGRQWRGVRHLTYFFNFGTPFMSALYWGFH